MTPCYCALLRTATRKIGSIYDAALAPLGINIAQYSLLRTVQRLQPVSLTELAGSLELDRSTVGRNVRVLERIGLTESERNGDDNREARVTLSARGVDALGKAVPVWEECQHQIEASLGAIKVTALQDILHTI
ncbi:MarR family transcriptional regulator [Mesorhizobium sp. DCY119]|uniref:MarR family winged helix-turn-helix transcriptional regulator n=1 Tax=Mesorhizobium sp. DCY119 TaxID=2108445 RepID=UPI000E71B6D6|nr:MarR family transcriptional regulator [Mesorhizobium sp. DCY119]RJG39964.1 MarR family transcriptional regulator [Mesorhizobium sp. DCY119]